VRAGVQNLNWWEHTLGVPGVSFTFARSPLICELMLFEGLRRRWLLKEPGSPPLLKPSLDVDGDTTHDGELRVVAPDLK
jgi:hypothetical protein